MLLLAGCGNPDALSQVSQITNLGQGQAEVYIANQSAFPADQLAGFVRAENVQLQRDFKPIWGIDAVVINSPPPSTDALQLVFVPDLTPFDKRYAAHHAIRFKHQAYINYSITGPEGSTTSTASHECMEMLANPTDDPKGPQICDPVAPYGNPIEGVELADFTFPAYRIPGAPPPYDFLGLVTRQGVPAPGGFNFGEGYGN